MFVVNSHTNNDNNNNNTHCGGATLPRAYTFRMGSVPSQDSRLLGNGIGHRLKEATFGSGISPDRREAIYNKYDYD